MRDALYQPVQIELGEVLSDPVQLGGGALFAEVVLRPSGRIVDARLLNFGQGSGKGVFIPVQYGDDVVVLFPRGSPNDAIAIGGFGSNRNPTPNAADGSKIVLVHPGGVELRHDGTGQPHAIVYAPFLDGLQGLVTALTAFMATAAALAATFPADPSPSAKAISAAAGTFLGNTNVVEFVASLATSNATGGAPYASDHHRVS